MGLRVASASRSPRTVSRSSQARAPAAGSTWALNVQAEQRRTADRGGYPDE
jgi:hypothetical protein